jgi:hypothetical protein
MPRGVFDRKIGHLFFSLNLCSSCFLERDRDPVSNDPVEVEGRPQKEKALLNRQEYLTVLISRRIL